MAEFEYLEKPLLLPLLWNLLVGCSFIVSTSIDVLGVFNSLLIEVKLEILFEINVFDCCLRSLVVALLLIDDDEVDATAAAAANSFVFELFIISMNCLTLRANNKFVLRSRIPGNN